MKRRRQTDRKRFTRMSRISIYGRVFFWVFLTILSIEIVIISASYLLHNSRNISLQQQTIILIFFGSLLSIIISFSIIWAIRLILDIYDRQRQITSDDELELLNDLEMALEQKELTIYFQPQINLQTGYVVGMETLLRWQHPKRGMIMPSVFIPIAEKCGLIDIISEWTLLQACLYNKKLLDIGYNLRVAVNISRAQFKNPLLVEHVQRILSIAQLPAQNLELEITETTMMDDIEFAIATMVDLRSIGILLSIDDFGMGYSSLSELDRLPIHKLKIDKAFVQSIDINDTESNLVYSIVQIGHKLRLLISVEGIETEQQKIFFAKLQCHEGQGYYISAPIPAIHFEKYLATLA